MEQILLASSLLKENVAAIMMLYKKNESEVYSLDEDKDYFDILAGVLQGYTLVLYLFIIRLDYVFRTSIDKMKDNYFMLAKKQKIPCTNNYERGQRR